MTKLYTDPFGPPWRLNWLRLLVQWEGGIFQFFWVEWFVATAVCALCVVLVYYARKDVNQTDIEDVFEGFAETIDFVTARFQSALSLMLGFYTTTIYGRWWKVRDIEGVVIGRINDLAVQIAGMVRDTPFDSEQVLFDKEQVKSEDNSGEKKRLSASTERFMNISSVSDVRLHLVRWLNLSHAIAVGELYEKKPNEFSSLEQLRDYGLATDREYDFLKEQTRSRYVAPFVWFTDLVMELKDKQMCGISEGSLQVFANNITRIRGSLADLYMYRNVPVPLAYRQLVNFTVRLYMLIVLVAASTQDVLEPENYGGLTDGAFWIILAFSFEYFLFVGWLTQADALGNPFRCWSDEFEWENYVKSLTVSSLLISSGFRDGSMSLKAVHQSRQEINEKLLGVCEKWETSPHEQHHSLYSALKDTVRSRKGREEARKYVAGF